MTKRRFQTFESKFQSQLQLRRNQINQLNKVFVAIKSTIETKSQYLIVKSQIVQLKSQLRELNLIQAEEVQQYKSVIQARRNSQENQQKHKWRQEQSLARRERWLQSQKQPVAV